MVAKTRVLIAGVRGKLGRDVAEAVLATKDIELFPLGLDAKELDDVGRKYVEFSSGRRINVVHASQAEELLTGLHNAWPGLIVAHATTSAAVKDASALYDRCNLPYLMLTTGGELTSPQNVIAVPAVNTARPVARLNRRLETFADEHPGILEGCRLDMRESHQAAKGDFSGTANKVAGYFEKMGVLPAEITRNKRRQEAQYQEWKIPEQFWGRHGWHKYRVSSEVDCRGLIKLNQLLKDFMTADPSLEDYETRVVDKDGASSLVRVSPSGNARFELVTWDASPRLSKFGTFINGGDIYGQGAVRAIRQLRGLMNSGASPGTYSLDI